MPIPRCPSATSSSPRRALATSVAALVPGIRTASGVALASVVAALLLARAAPAFERHEFSLDPSQGLEFLDVSLTLDRSHDDLVGSDGSDEFAPGGDFEGLRYATTSEVLAFFENAAIDTQANATEDNFSPVLSLQRTLGGPTFAAGDVENLFAISGTLDGGTGLVHRFVLGLDHGAGTGLGELNALFDPAVASSSAGSFLVREVAPLPPRHAYVASYPNATISVIDLQTRAVVDSIFTSAGVSALAVSPDGERLYAAHIGADRVSVIDTATNSVLDAFDVGAVPREVAVSNKRKLIFVTHRDENFVRVLNAVTGELVESIPMSGGSFGIDRSPDGSRMYVATLASRDVEVIDVQSLSVIDASTSNGFGYDVSVGKQSGALYSVFSSALTETDPDSLEITASLAVGPDSRGLAVAEHTGRVYASSTDDATVAVVDLARFELVATVAAGSTAPTHAGSLAPGVAVSDEGDLVLVANASDGTVSVIDTLSNLELEAIAIAGVPYDVVIVPEPAACGLGLAALLTLAVLARRRS